jgi:hypothetical protein
MISHHLLAADTNGTMLWFVVLVCQQLYASLGHAAAAGKWHGNGITFKINMPFLAKDSKCISFNAALQWPHHL